MDFVRCESKGILCKAEDNQWMAREGAMPLEVLGSKLPVVTSWDLIPDGEGKKVGGRAIGETNNQGEKYPVTKRGKLVCNLPISGVIGVWDIIEDGIRL